MLKEEICLSQYLENNNYPFIVLVLVTITRGHLEMEIVFHHRFCGSLCKVARAVQYLNFPLLLLKFSLSS